MTNDQDDIGGARPPFNRAHLDEKQLAARWRVSVKAIQAARYKGGGAPYLKIGRNVRYPLDEVERHEAAALRASTSDAGAECRGARVRRN